MSASISGEPLYICLLYDVLQEMYPVIMKNLPQQG